MALIVEDGSIVANANSYVNLADALARSIALGVTSISDDIEVGGNQLIQAAYNLDRTYRSQYNGSVSDDSQSLQWPRIDVKIYGVEFPADMIPQEVIDSQIYLAGYIADGVDLNPTDNGREVSSEEVVGAVKQAYFQNYKTGATVSLIGVENTIKPVIGSNNSAGGNSIKVWA